jgi:hypothetical protein
LRGMNWNHAHLFPSLQRIMICSTVEYIFYLSYNDARREEVLLFFPF